MRTSCLVAARTVLDEPGALGRAARRSAAFLIRTSLESTLRVFLNRAAPGATAANFTVRLHCLLHLHEDHELAARVAWTWAALSRATHHHGYEIPPPRRDLDRWMATVAEFQASVGSAPR